MSDLELLRTLGDQVHPPAFDDLAATARRRNRRRSATVVTSALAAVAVVIGGGLLLGDSDRRTEPPVLPPTQTPSPSPEPEPTPTIDAVRTSLTPEEVVTDPDAELILFSAALGDSDVRLAVWEAVCEDCAHGPDSGPPRFRGMALTTDGYRTTLVLRPTPAVRLGLPLRVASPSDDLFLLYDESNGGEALLGVDGSFRRVRRVTTPITPADPRLWFECFARDGETALCALDPDTATAYQWPVAWSRSVALPGTGEEPWGWDATGSDSDSPSDWGREAWWDVDGVRQTRPLIASMRGPGGKLLGVADSVQSPPGGGPMYWRYDAQAKTVDVLVGRDRSAPWQVTTLAAPKLSMHTEMRGTADGGLLAWTTWPRVSIWRADSVGAGELRPVYSADPGEPETQQQEIASLGERIQIATGGAVLESTDDGRTWTRITTWR